MYWRSTVNALFSCCTNQNRGIEHICCNRQYHSVQWFFQKPSCSTFAPCWKWAIWIVSTCRRRAKYRCYPLVVAVAVVVESPMWRDSPIPDFVPIAQASKCSCPLLERKINSWVSIVRPSISRLGLWGMRVLLVTGPSQRPQSRFFGHCRRQCLQSESFIGTMSMTIIRDKPRLQSTSSPEIRIQYRAS